MYQGMARCATAVTIVCQHHQHRSLPGHWSHFITPPSCQCGPLLQGHFSAHWFWLAMRDLPSLSANIPRNGRGGARLLQYLTPPPPPAGRRDDKRNDSCELQGGTYLNQCWQSNCVLRQPYMYRSLKLQFKLWSDLCWFPAKTKQLLHPYIFNATIQFHIQDIPGVQQIYRFVKMWGGGARESYLARWLIYFFSQFFSQNVSQLIYVKSGLPINMINVWVCTFGFPMHSLYTELTTNNPLLFAWLFAGSFAKTFGYILLGPY